MICQLQNQDDFPETHEDESTSPDKVLSAGGENLIFGRQKVSLSTLHPNLPQIFRLWQTFLDNVNPLVKLLHAPSTQQLILDAVADLSSAPKSTEALIFAVYLAAVTSMHDQECQRFMGDSRTALLAKFSNATQQALVNAEFLKSTSLVVLQAFTLYLVSWLLQSPSGVILP